MVIGLSLLKKRAVLQRSSGFAKISVFFISPRLIASPNVKKGNLTPLIS